MKEPCRDTDVTINSKMSLHIKECRGTSHMTSPKEGYSEVSNSTKTWFHWRLKGIASKVGAEIINSGTRDWIKEQELYHVRISSDMWDTDYHSQFKSREDAIRAAMAFAERNGIEVDGYEHREKK